jgi:mRNA interferase HigB
MPYSHHGKSEVFVNVIALRALKTFYERHPQAKMPMIAWYREVTTSRWESLHDIKSQFPSADYVGDDRIVFNIGGNKYRIIARVAFGPWYRVMIKFVGTHAEYDRVDARTV